MAVVFVSGSGVTGPQGAQGPQGAAGADGDATAYTPAQTTDWAGADPTTIAAALDRLAAHVNDVLLGGAP